MAITKSAKKAHRASLNKRVFNLRRKRALNDSTKEVKKLIAEGKGKDAAASLSAAYKAIDKAAKRGVIKKNTAARKKSRLAKALAK
ncbi:MAG: 30S ribosomal protein S20 [Patescibacteria group bacterium]